MKDILLGIGKSIGKTIVDDISKNKEKYDRTAIWAESKSDERLKEEFKRKRDHYQKKAIYDELKRRGY